MTVVAEPVELAAGRATGRGWRDSPLVAPLLALAGTAVVVLAGTLPVWGTTLRAPQYPRGLSLWFYGGRAEGPVREVNGLNHYIGMQPIDLSKVPELGLWPLAIVGCVAMLAWAVFMPRWWGRLAVLGLFLVPLGILLDIQRWLMIFGSQLDPDSALRLDPFVPLVVGPSTVWNFTIWTYPGPALGLIWLAAVIAFVARRAARPTLRLRAATSLVALAIGVTGTLALVVPAVTPEDSATTGGGPPAGPVDLVRLVEAAPAGATVVVPAGSYAVHLEIVRPLTLVADGEVWLDGGGRGTIITIRADDVTVRGFHLAGTGGQVEEAAGIKTVEASRVSIESNMLHAFFTGISVNGGQDVRIVDNTLVGSGQVTLDAGHAAGGGSSASGQDAGDGRPAATPDPADPHAGHGLGAGPAGQGDGISVWTTRGVLVRGNTVSDVRDALYLNYAEEVLVDSNLVERSRYALHSMFGRDITVFANTARANLSGLVFMYTHGVLAGRNSLTDARSAGTGYGIVVKDVVRLRVAENVIARNRVGLHAEGVEHRLDDEALVVRNRFAANDVGLALMATADLAFAANDFDANLVQVVALEPGVERHNDWANGGTGNTWSDYAGFDLAGDGVGDIPYTTGGSGEILLAADPALAAYRTSPALAVLDVARAVWESAAEPVVRDDFPRLVSAAAGEPGSTDPSSPAAGDPAAGDQAAGGEHAGHGAAGPVAVGAPGSGLPAVAADGLGPAAWYGLGALLLVSALATPLAMRGGLSRRPRTAAARPLRPGTGGSAA